jgi:hypothetical protein
MYIYRYVQILFPHIRLFSVFQVKRIPIKQRLKKKILNISSCLYIIMIIIIISKSTIVRMPKIFYIVVHAKYIELRIANWSVTAVLI